MASTQSKAADHLKVHEKADPRLDQIELGKRQRRIIETGQKVLVIFESLDAAGKDGAIKRIVEHLSPREVHVVALEILSDRDGIAWYYHRYVANFPVDVEIVLFNGSWYTLAGAEHVIGSCLKAEYVMFFKATPLFEDLLENCGMTVVKYDLDISKTELKRRLIHRRDDPQRQRKSNPGDNVAIKHWDDYSAARDVMLKRTHSLAVSWSIERADDKPLERINIIKDQISRLDGTGKQRNIELADGEIVIPF